MIVGKFVIQSFAKFFIGDDFRHVLQQVKDAEYVAEDGQVKRQAVIESIEAMGIALTGWLLNLAIELAVALIRSKA